MDAVGGGYFHSLTARKAPDWFPCLQLCEQFTEPHQGHRLVELESCAGGDSMEGSFERDFVLISAVPEPSSPSGSSSVLSDGDHANAAIANVTITRGSSTPSASREHQPPPAPAVQLGEPSLPLPAETKEATEVPRTAPAQSGGAALLKAAARLLLDLSASRSSAGAAAEALVLSVLALQTLSAASSLDPPVSKGVRGDMAAALSQAQEATETLHKQEAPGCEALPCPLELVYRLALDYGRAGAVDELMGNFDSSCQEYGAAITLFTFLLCEVPRLPPSGVLPAQAKGRDLPSGDERRLRRWAASPTTPPRAVSLMHMVSGILDPPVTASGCC